MAAACVATALLAFFGLGRLVFQAAGLRWRSPAARELAAVVAGMDLFALAMACLALARLRLPPPAAFACAALPFAAWGLWTLLKEASRWRAHLGRAKLLPAALLLAPLAFYLGSALCPPSGWDELVYQIAAPERWLRSGFRETLGDLPYTGFPSLPQLLYWPLLAWGHAIAAKLLSFASFALLCAGAFMLCRTRASIASSAAAMAAFMLAPIVSALCKEAYAEQFIALNMVVALLIMRGSRPSWRSTLFAGAAAGACAAVKLTGVFAASAAAALSAAPGKRHLRTAALIALAAAIFIAPFYLKPLLDTGNPFHPYCASLFSGDEAAKETSKFHHDIGSARYGADGIAGLLATPLLLGIPCAPFDRANDGSFGLQLLLLLALAALALKAGSSKRGAAVQILAAAALYLLWFMTAKQARFLLPAFILLLPLAAAGLSSLRGGYAKAALAGLLAITALSFPPAALKHFAISWRSLADPNGQTSIVYSGTGPGYLEAVDALLSKTPEDAKALLLFEERTLYIPRSCVIGTPFFQSGLLTPPDRLDANALREALRKGAFTHLLIRSPENCPDLLPEYLDRCGALLGALGGLVADGSLKEIFSGPGSYAIYEVRLKAQK